MAVAQVEDAPLEEPIVLLSDEAKKRINVNEERGDLRINPRWYDWIWQSLLKRLNSAPSQFGTVVSKQGLTAAQGVTAIVLPALAQGRYRATVHVKVRTAAGANSQILVTIGYTNNGVACSQSTTNLTTNTTASVEGKVIPIVCDQASPITWSTTYVSAGAPPMAYDVDISLEAQN